MVDVSQITSQIYVGGAISTKADVEELVDLGITADIDLRLEFDDASLVDPNAKSTPNAHRLIRTNPKIAYLFNGVADDGEPKPVSWFKKSWDFAFPILANGGVLLVHCAQGVNRSPSTAYFLVRAFNHMNRTDAYDLIVSKRPVALVAYRDDADRAIEALGL